VGFRLRLENAQLPAFSSLLQPISKRNTYISAFKSVFLLRPARMHSEQQKCFSFATSPDAWRAAKVPFFCDQPSFFDAHSELCKKSNE